MSARSLCRCLILGSFLSWSWVSPAMLWAEDKLPPLSTEEATSKDKAAWRELLQKEDYAALEKIGDELRATHSKYPNGRGRLWKYSWIALRDNRRQMTEADYAESFAQLERWLKEYPKSVNARLLLAKTWQEYASGARFGRIAPNSGAEQMRLFQERSDQAATYLDQIDQLTKSVDDVYRRLRMEIAKGQGEKPDVQLVFDGLKDDPRCMELVHGMTICLLPRFFGEEGELESFVDEVVRITKDDCGEMQYAVAAIATKEFLKSFMLDTHEFDWPRIRQGFRDWERIYPRSVEHLNDEAQLAFMAQDLDAVHETMAKLGKHTIPYDWNTVTEIQLDKFQQRITPEMLNGDQKRLLLGHTWPVMALQPLGRGDVVASVGWHFAVWLHDVPTAKRRGWIYMEGIHGDSVSIHPQTGLMAVGSEDEPGLTLYSFTSGNWGEQRFSQAKVHRTAISPAGDLVAAADHNGLIAVIDAKTEEVQQQFPPDGRRGIVGLSFNAAGTRLAAVLGSGEILVFELAEKKLANSRKVSDKGLRGVTATQGHFAVGTANGQVLVLNDETLETVAQTQVEEFDVAALAFSPDGATLAFGVRTGHWETPMATPLYVWQHGKESPPVALKGHKMGINTVKFSPDGKSLFSGSYDWTIRVWDVPTNK